MRIRDDIDGIMVCSTDDDKAKDAYAIVLDYTRNVERHNPIMFILYKGFPRKNKIENPQYFATLPAALVGFAERVEKIR